MAPGAKSALQRRSYFGPNPKGLGWPLNLASRALHREKLDFPETGITYAVPWRCHLRFTVYIELRYKHLACQCLASTAEPFVVWRKCMICGELPVDYSSCGPSLDRQMTL
jgi:hypothetical protein